MSEQNVGYGEDATEDDPWENAAKELSPDNSLARIAANARFTVATVTAVGTALTALGIVTVQTVNTDRISRVFAISSACAGLLAVLLALLYLALRIRLVNPQDLVQVEEWYRSELRRTWLAVAASWLLIVAVALAGIAGLHSAFASRGERTPQLALRVAGTRPERKVIASAKLVHMRVGGVVVLRLSGETIGSKPVLLVESRMTVNDSGTAMLSTGATTVIAYPKYLLVVFLDGRRLGSMTAP
jgi:hypothetical protein